MGTRKLEFLPYKRQIELQHNHNLKNEEQQERQRLRREKGSNQKNQEPSC